jgi:hypothetical protein
VVFPFDFGSTAANDLAHFVLALLVFATSIATVVMAVMTLIEFVRLVVQVPEA